ncbi:zinc dependent phospholipase C family protein [Adhaeribacter pallidiroseus]|uniref:zinc dependent phospholipase C family protein n=1 Tax=Adhaeribacter pallidiroseus TaxID=2072847 RepID=UPI001F41E922|nr:zinc dependent phospholipase C family protein [Adhaeribacter pallidiroseus]
MWNKRRFLISLLLLLLPPQVFSWGFFAHQRINRLAVFTLPPEMIGFYKQHLAYLTENAVNPDKRRYMLPQEGPRHFIDLDVYGDSAALKLPRTWQAALTKFTEDSLMKHGIVPWHINRVKNQLTEAFKQHDQLRILQISADLGHYVADACVPLHTTHNYNGQFTNQRGIHGLWESRLPELLADQYDFLVGPAQYINQPQVQAWKIVQRSNGALDSVFRFEQEVSASFSADRKYAFEERGGTTVRVYAAPFSKAYHQRLHGQVERQMRLAIKLVASYWYTSWVDAGQPDLRNLQPLTESQKKLLLEEKQQLKPVLTPERPHEAF